jgi:glycosyltransferase involved in cell wall biosynthesis
MRARSLIIPVYLNEENIPELVAAVRELAGQAPGIFEAVFVVDGSPDGSYARLSEALPSAGFAARLILLSRNFGSFTAIRAGLTAAKGDSFAVMAADLQDPPALIADMFAALDSGTCDVVVGSRASREDPFFSRLCARLFWAVYRRCVEPALPRGGVDVFGCNAAFREVLLRMDEAHSSLVGLIYWMGFRRTEISYARALRRQGRSAWSFRRKLRYLSDSIFSFTDLPVRILLVSGALGMTLSVGLGFAALAGRLLGWITVPGYTATILVLLFFGGTIQLGLGIVGSYVWRAYENTKHRPSFIVMREDAFTPR